MRRSTDDETTKSFTRASHTQNYNLQSVNPWEHDSRQIMSIRMSLILAGQMGVRTMEDESRCAYALAELPSSKLIALQKDLTTKNKSLQQVKQSIATHSQEKETADFLHLDVTDTRIKKIKQLCSDFDTVLQNTDKLIHRLQKPFVGDFLKINATYHRHASEVFTQMVPTLNDLSVYLDNITWAANNDFSPSHLESLLVEIQSLTASLQTSYHTLRQMTKGIESLGHTKISSTDLEASFSPDTTLHSLNSIKSAGTMSSSNTLTRNKTSGNSRGSSRVK